VIYLLDTSALVKRYVTESGSEHTRRISPAPRADGATDQCWSGAWGAALDSYRRVALDGFHISPRGNHDFPF
jgi:predicted nucleic acid-binding protein